MKLTKLLILFLFLSIKGFSQEAVLTSSGDKVILNFLSSSGGTITGTLGVTGNTTISGTTTLTGINNTGTITNTGAFTNTGNLTLNGNGTITGTLGVTGATTITGTLTLPSLSASTLLGTNSSKGVGTVSLTGDITTIGLVATLSNTGVISGTYGSSTEVPQITVDSKGRITTITTSTITAGGGTTHTISETFGGGIVFYVYDNGKHGLIAATSDQSTGIKWTITNTETNAVRDGIHGGISNTERIIINQGTGSYAAQICANYKGGNYADWYLPSKYELNLMFEKIGQGASSPYTNVGGFANSNYWSSTEDDTSIAWRQFFNGGTQSNTLNSKDDLYRVRAIRAF
jgi:hypothetical protein